MEYLGIFSPLDWGILLIFLITLGTVAGFLAGLLGVGGGLVLVPGLFYLFQSFGYEGPSLMQYAVGTSIGIIVPTGIFSAHSHWKRNAVDQIRLQQLGLGVLPGVVAGMVFVSQLTGAALQIIFATLLTGLVFFMLLSSGRYSLHDGPSLFVTRLAGFLIGLVSTLIGIGGATLSVPFMILSRIPMHRAIGTAAALGVVISVPAAIGFIVIGWGAGSPLPFSLGFINGPAWICIIPASMLAAPVGARVSHKIPVKPLRRVFAGFMILVAAKMWMEIL